MIQAPEKQVAQTPGSGWLCRVIGGVCGLGCAALLIWTVVLTYVDYSFNSAPANVQTMPSSALTTYGLHLEGLLKLDPTNGAIRNRYASVLGRQGQSEKAIEQLQIAKRTLHVLNSLFFIADMQESLKHYDQAEATMSDCLVINPTALDFNTARLRLLNMRLSELEARRGRGEEVNLNVYHSVAREFGEAATNWIIRAPNDANSYLFYGNFLVAILRLYQQEYGGQAYRSFLVGISQAPWLQLSHRLMIEPKNVLKTVQQILNARLARPYRNLP